MAQWRHLCAVITLFMGGSPPKWKLLARSLICQIDCNLRFIRVKKSVYVIFNAFSRSLNMFLIAAPAGAPTNNAKWCVCMKILLFNATFYIAIASSVYPVILINYNALWAKLIKSDQKYRPNSPHYHLNYTHHGCNYAVSIYTKLQHAGESCSPKHLLRRITCKMLFYNSDDLLI